MSAAGPVEQRLAELADRHPRAARTLAVHAALPAAVDPALLHLLRDCFLLDGPVPERLPVTAESEAVMARLLLSPLFTQVDDELFEMHKPARAVLLRELQDLDGGRRIAEVAALLEQYTLEHPGWSRELRWAQRVSCRVAADPQAVEDWLTEGADRGGGGGLDARWFAAMRTRIEQDRAIGATVPGHGADTDPAPVGGPGDGTVMALTNGTASARAFRVTSFGLYVTPAHVVSGASASPWRIAPLDGSGVTRAVDVVAVDDSGRDIAFLLDRGSAPAPALTLAAGSGFAVGQVLRPVGATFDVSRVLVRAVGIGTDGSDVALVHTDRALGPGSSGSVLLDDGGRVVGVHVARTSEEPDGGGVALAADVVVAAMAAVLAPALLPSSALTADDGRLYLRVAEVARSLGLAGRAQAYAGTALKVGRSTGHPELVDDALDVLAPAGPARTDRLGDLSDLATALDHASILASASERAAARGPVLAELRTRLHSPRPFLPAALRGLLRSTSAGERLVGIVALQVAPDAACLDALSMMVGPQHELHHVAYQAAVALRNAAEFLPAEHLEAVEHALLAAVGSLEGFRRSDRAVVLGKAREVVAGRRLHRPAGRMVKHSPWRLWPNGSVLRVRFLAGAAELQAQVRALAELWTAGTGVGFAFGDPEGAEPAQIRVTFSEGGSSWSFLGTEARTVAADRPTMSIETGTSGDWFRKQVLVEFGHALGLVSEHQQPNADLPWDLDALYRTYTGPPHHLTREIVETNFLTRYEFPTPPAYRPFDPRSVMLHAIDSAVFTGGFHAPLNTALSASDREFIARLYPPPASTAVPERVPFQLVRRLDRGPAGELWLALDERTGSDVDVLAPQSTPRDTVLAAAGVTGPTVVGVLDVRPGDPPDAVVTEHVAGTPLDALVHERGALPPAQVLRIGIAVAHALDGVHTGGMVHGHVDSPGSVMVEPDGGARLRLLGPHIDGLLRGDSAASDVRALIRILTSAFLGTSADRPPSSAERVRAALVVGTPGALSATSYGELLQSRLDTLDESPTADSPTA